LTLAVKASLVNSIAAGTPTGEDGSADPQYVLKVERGIAPHIEGFRIIVENSIFPVETAGKVHVRKIGRIPDFTSCLW
jgi:UDPglucose 6-dehydrogenase